MVKLRTFNAWRREYTNRENNVCIYRQDGFHKFRVRSGFLDILHVFQFADERDSFLVLSKSYALGYAGLELHTVKTAGNPAVADVFFQNAVEELQCQKFFDYTPLYQAKILYVYLPY